MSSSQPSRSGVEKLNSSCFCITLDVDALRTELERSSELRGIPMPKMFASMPVFVSRDHLNRMESIIKAIEQVIALPTYQEMVLGRSPQIAREPVSNVKGVFLSYDFHVSESGPKLIEINTNAGGALLNAALARAQRACCPATAGMTTGPVPLEAIEQTYVDMFLNEWRLARADQKLQRIAIVDENPEDQYLYNEFVLFRELFRRHGIEANISDPRTLRLHDNVLWHAEEPIDLVYNRLTDFMLEAPANAVLREAYLSRAVIVTPNPRIYALYADKRNLALLTHLQQLDAIGVPEDVKKVLLGGISRTWVVRASDAPQLWTERRKLFFKPAAGFGSKAAYRGDKLTKRVWEQILTGEYVAQDFVPPSERFVAFSAKPSALKFDVRFYVYDRAVQFIAARLYQGQTTNFRTPGGGFAPVFTNTSLGLEMMRAQCEAPPACA